MNALPSAPPHEPALSLRAGRFQPGDRERAARVFHALSDVTRLGIVERLLSGEQCVCELSELLDAGQSRLSFHLRTLKDAGVVTDRREGRWVYYALEPALLELLGRLCAELGRAARTARVECCGRSAEPARGRGPSRTRA